jgi:predicted transcriptional regulator
MPRQKKDARPLNIKLQTEVYDLLDKYTADTGVPKTVVVEKALAEYLKKQKK